MHVLPFCLHKQLPGTRAITTDFTFDLSFYRTIGFKKTGTCLNMVLAAKTEMIIDFFFFEKTKNKHCSLSVSVVV